ncbi:hypothetical protein ACOSP7_024659 [Xanthoceras sorbifolium]
MASMQWYKPADQNCNPVTYPPMANPGQTQCYGQSQAYYTEHGMAKPQTPNCYSQTQTPTGYGSGLGMGMTHAMGSTHGTPGYSHGSSHCMDQNKVYSYGHGYGHGPSQNHHTATYGSNGMARYGKTKKNGHVYRRNRDGHCSDSCSDSDSDDEHCGRRMHC